MGETIWHAEGELTAWGAQLRGNNSPGDGGGEGLEKLPHELDPKDCLGLAWGGGDGEERRRAFE